MISKNEIFNYLHNGKSGRKWNSTGITLLNATLNLLIIELLNIWMQVNNNKYIIMADIDYLYTMFRQEKSIPLSLKLMQLYIFYTKNDDTWSIYGW